MLKATGLIRSLVVGATLCLAGAARADDVPAVDPALHAAVPASFQQAGVKAAAFNDWPPDEFTDKGTLMGWSIDMAHAMSARIGVPFELTGTSFDAIIPGIASGRFDVGFSSFGVTPERLKVLDFVPQRMEGTGYASLSNKFVPVEKVEDLCGHSVAVLTGAWDYQFLLKVSAESCASKGGPAIDLQQFATQNNAELAVSSGRVELVAAGSAKLSYLAKQIGTFSVASYTSNAVYNGIGVKKGSPIGPVLRDALQKMMDDGSYRAIMAKWGVDKNGMLNKAILVTEADPDPKP